MIISLYEDITTGNLYTFSELKQEYEVSHNCEIPVDDDTMIQIIHENVWSVGGNVLIICDNDSVLKWCNDYSQFMEAEKHMTTEEIENFNNEKTNVSIIEILIEKGELLFLIKFL